MCPKEAVPPALGHTPRHVMARRLKKSDPTTRVSSPASSGRVLGRVSTVCHIGTGRLSRRYPLSKSSRIHKELMTPPAGQRTFVFFYGSHCRGSDWPCNDATIESNLN